MQDALRVLLESCLRAAHERPDVRRSLGSLNAWLGRELERIPEPSKANPDARSRDRSHGVLTPAARGRGDESGEEDKGRITSDLSTVVTRARWKAAACRLSLDKYRERAKSQESEGDQKRDESEPISVREKSLRQRLSTLPDTSTWMIDMPFGKRASEADAFDVEPETAAQLETIAGCYDAIAFGAEVAMELDEGGAFRKAPPASFLYLLAEAQSALLKSLENAPTRSDSDQRDIFLWLKNQTTRYRIYVDRYMRLDDPADPSVSKDLQERLRKTAREIVERTQLDQGREQLLAKVRYHVGKLEGSDNIRPSEVESLEHALDAWADAGGARNDKRLVQILAPLAREATQNVDQSDEVSSPELAELLMAYAPGGRAADAHGMLTPSKGPAPNVSGPGQTSGRRAQAGGPSTSADERAVDGSAPDSGCESASSSTSISGDAERAATLIAEASGLLATHTVKLLVAPDAVFDEPELGRVLGARSFTVARVDPEGDSDARTAVLQSVLDEEIDLYLLGIRLASEDYGSFKERCLEKGRLFVRLPGSVDATAISHQVLRQVGWRLRALGGR